MRIAQIFLALSFIPGSAGMLAGQTRPPRDKLLDLLLFCCEPPDPSQYPVETQKSLNAFIGRFRRFKTLLPHDAKTGEMQMVQSRHICYEKRLAAFSGDAHAPQLAADYVRTLRPCYEWEGFHDCPESEARFAQEYLRTHQSSPFGELLVLLAAHRWLCTAELYEFEKDKVNAVSSRDRFSELISRAEVSTDPLVRAAAHELKLRNTCF